MKADRILPIILPFVALLAAVLACQADNMRARDLPVWTCPTAAPPATVIPAPTSTVLPGTPTATPAATTTPWPTATPYALTSDFPLERSVKIGGVGGVGLGIWVWMADTEVDGPFIREAENSQPGGWPVGR